MFRKYKGMRLTYDKQGYIYFFCRNFSALSPENKRRVTDACARIAGEEADVLLALLTGRKSARHLSLTRYISEGRLYRWRREFFESFDVH